MRLKYKVFIFIFLFSCSENAVKRQYIQAEKLWSQGYYQASVKELEVLLRKEGQNEDDPIITQALYRAGMTQTLYLFQHEEALQKFEAYLKRKISKDQKKAVEFEMGEILFARLKIYERAYNHYDKLDKSTLTLDELHFIEIRKARCMHFLWKFDEAIKILEPLIKNIDNKEREIALIELGNIYLTYSRSPQNLDKKVIELNKNAILLFEEYLNLYPSGKHLSEAVIGLATAYEQMDQLEKALLVLEEIEKKITGSKKLLILKKDRIKERILRRKR